MVSTEKVGVSGHKEVTYEEVRAAMKAMDLVRPIMSFANRMNDPALRAYSRSPHFRQLGTLDFVVNHSGLADKIEAAYSVLKRAEEQADVAGDAARDYWRTKNVPPVSERLLPSYRLVGPDGQPMIPVAIWISVSSALDDFERMQNDERLSILAEREYSKVA